MQYPRVIHMFSKEDAISAEGNMPGTPRTGDEAKRPRGKPKPATKTFPRTVRRFSKPEEGGTD